MKRILFSLLALSSIYGSAQTVLLNEGFENYTDFAISGLGNWQTLDLDGLTTYYGGGPVIAGETDPSWEPNWPNVGQPMAFQIFNPSNSNVTNNLTATDADEEVRNFTPHSGQKYAASWAGSPAGGITANNDWLISPAITLGSNSNTLTFWVKSMSQDYSERYKVGVYVGNGTPTAAANFTIISGTAAKIAPYANWQEVTLNLDTYAGQTIKIGFQYMSANQYMFMLDDVKVTASGVLATNEVSKTKSNTSLYPNPTKGEVHIKTDKKVKTTSVFDMTGKIAHQGESGKTDISSLPKGTYLMKIEFEDGTSATEKIIKQ
ncbi:MAG: T9SS type A sorting domain-containing protein [Chryseobacterium sp.]|jgi:hypothetical protein|uniref:T9SS-dependent choice-of-anchor J family protein n=1 Tax=Chryseobacterium sp. TaxID=1871047 RepID=UPI00281D9A67|nr:choice-of-anchor J domain-containing protein [Chryseobacterium sp.]MDR2234628.1 T9SS type A sorting domain-containing protein [Chryseobacterium sp.]